MLKRVSVAFGIVLLAACSNDDAPTGAEAGPATTREPLPPPAPADAREGGTPALPPPDADPLPEPCTQPDSLPRCVGDVVYQCTYRAAGRGIRYYPIVDCAAGGGTCANGVCSGTCPAGARYCTDILTERSCDSGGQWQERRCPTPCTENGCWECNFRDRRCIGNLTQECRNVAGAPTPRWADAETCTIGCVGGYCEGQRCTPGKRRCNGQAAEVCTTDARWEKTEDCPGICSAGLCRGLCMPGAQQCFIDRELQVCDDSGFWITSKVCPGGCAGLVCAGAPADSGSPPPPDAGSPPPPIDAAAPGACLSGGNRCTGDLPQLCVNGAWIDLPRCQFGCAGPEGGPGACAVCRPGTRSCVGSAVMMCKDTVTLEKLEECPNDCTNGACTGVCRTYQRRCIGNVAEVCMAGQWQSQTCTGLCRDGTCTGQCVPGVRECRGRTPYVCNGDGFWITEPTCPGACRMGACGTSLGESCPVMSCTGSYCHTRSAVCGDSDLAENCHGTRGLYCTRSCTSDADCAGGVVPMKCLVSCPDDPTPGVGGSCWTERDHAFMVSVCQ